MATATMTERQDGWYTVRFPYDPRTIAELKSRIDAAARSWDPEHKVWIVAGYMQATMQWILEERFESVRIHHWKREEARAGHGIHTSPDGPFAVLHLLHSAPPPLVHGAYKILARLYHPDTGGDVGTMQRVNAAYDELKTRIGER